MRSRLPYDEYLLTPHWKQVRHASLSRANNKCALCGNKERPLEVHHNNYESLWGELLSDLLVLCDECHERHHKVMVVMHETHAGMVCPQCGIELVAQVRLLGEVVT